MDLKALMQKLETINGSKQYLTESEEKEHADKKPCPPMSHVKKMCQDGKSVAEICKMHPDCDHTELKQMVADCKETMGKDKKKTDESIVFTSSIARSLAEEFGYELDERGGQFGYTPSAAQQAPVTSGTGIPVTDGSGNPVQSGSTPPAAPPAAGANPWEGKDPAKAAAWAKLSPEDQKWLGMADPTDNIILARAPSNGGFLGSLGFGKKKETPPAASGGATKPAAAPVSGAAKTDAEAAADKAKVQANLPANMSMNDYNKAMDRSEPEEPAASTTGTPPAGGAGGDAAVKATREKLTALLDKLEKTGGVTGSAPAPAAPAAPAKPASGGATKPATPAVSGAQSAGQSVGGAIKSGAQAVGDFAKGAYQGLTKESVTFEDDQTLLAIKNIRF
jgi:hypothetical protein